MQGRVAGRITANSGAQTRDIPIARRAQTVSRLAAVARERGEASEGLRRVLVIQSVRLAFLAACRLAEVEGRPYPEPEQSFNINELVGSVLEEDAGDDGSSDV